MIIFTQGANIYGFLGVGLERRVGLVVGFVIMMALSCRGSYDDEV